MTKVNLKLLIVCIVAGCLVATGTAFGNKSFLLNSQSEWEDALGGGGIYSMQDPMEWEDYMDQWQNFTKEGDPYPAVPFLPSRLYVWPGGGGGGLEPSDAGLVMVWGDDQPDGGYSAAQTQDGDYGAAYLYDYGLDPDLSNCTITVTVTAPQFDPITLSQINQVSLGLKNQPIIGGAIRAWYWNCGPLGSGAPIIWNTPTTIKINTAKTGLTAANPTATGYMNNPAFSLTTVQWIIVDENATWVGGPQNVPPPGQIIPGMWNYWHNLVVSPNPPSHKYAGKWFIKWSQPPVPIDPDGKPPIFNGWDERSDYNNVPPIVADDWQCKGNRPITDIHWWGSFIGWDLPLPPRIMPKAFHIGIWTDVPADPADPAASYSHPGTLIWENYCDNWVWNFAGYDKPPKAPGQLIADNPSIGGIGEFGWSNEWWFRGDNTAIIFKFTGLNPALILGSHVFVNFNLGVTNHLNGDFGLDGLVDITINPGSATSYTVTDVLFDNVDPTNLIGNWPGTGTGLCPRTTESYETTASLLVHKNNIQAGTLVIKIDRHSDTPLDYSPAAPCGMHPIDMSTSPPTVPPGCYDFDDAHTVHITVKATDSTGGTAASGEVTIWDTITPGHEKETCFQFTQLLSQDEWFEQQPDEPGQPDSNKIYWLSIAAIYNPWDYDNADFYPWGWKTRPRFFNDDAVRIMQAVNPDGNVWPLTPNLQIGAKWMDGVPIFFPTERDSWDMAFELTTNEGLSADLYRDGIVNLRDLAILAGQWLQDQ